MLLVPAVAIGVIWLWMAGVLHFRNPEGALTWVVIGAVGATAVIAAIEAEKSRSSENFEMSVAPPFMWFVLVAAFWPLAYPIYLHQRVHYGLKSMSLPAVIMVGVFSWTAVSLPGAIDQHYDALHREVQQYLESFQR